MASSGEVVSFARWADARQGALQWSGSIRVLLVAGSPVVRSGLQSLLEADSDIAVVAEAATGHEAAALPAWRRAHVALLDFRQATLDRATALRRILDDAPPHRPRVLLLMEDATDAELLGVLRAGASGLLIDDSEPVELRCAVRVLARGEAHLSPRLTHRLIQELTARPELEQAPMQLLDELTARERQVVMLVAAGLSNHEIAQRLVVSPATAKTHVSRAMIKLHARDRAKLVAIAYETGLVRPRGASTTAGDQQGDQQRHYQ